MLSRSTLKEAQRYWEMRLSDTNHKIRFYDLKFEAANRLRLRAADMDIVKLTDFEFRESCGVAMPYFSNKNYDSIGNLSADCIYDSLESVKRQWENYLKSLLRV